MIARFKQRRQEEINASSATAAMGWSALFNGLGGDSEQKATPQDFLPFDLGSSSKQSRISSRTKTVLKRLIDGGQLPPIMSTAFSSLLDS